MLSACMGSPHFEGQARFAARGDRLLTASGEVPRVDIRAGDPATVRLGEFDEEFIEVRRFGWP